MPETLIRPVVSETQVVHTDVTNHFGNEHTFSVPSDLGVGIIISPSYLSSDVIVKVQENETEALALDISPSSSDMDGFLRPWRFIYTETASEQKGIGAGMLSSGDPLFEQYALEHPSRLALAEGIDHRFVVGQKDQEVFVDGWQKEAQAPSWRVTIPIERSGSSVVIPEAKLLIFA